MRAKVTFFFAITLVILLAQASRKNIFNLQQRSCHCRLKKQADLSCFSVFLYYKWF